MADFISDYRENSDLHPDVSKIIIFSVYLAWKQDCLGGQRFSNSEWNRILKAGDLVVFGICGPVWYYSLTYANLYWKLLLNYWLIDCGTIHTLWIIKKYLFI